MKGLTPLVAYEMRSNIDKLIANIKAAIKPCILPQILNGPPVNSGNPLNRVLLLILDEQSLKCLTPSGYKPQGWEKLKEAKKNSGCVIKLTIRRRQKKVQAPVSILGPLGRLNEAMNLLMNS